MSYLSNETYIPRLVSETRLAQGLPERVDDPAALATVAALLASATQREIPEGTPIRLLRYNETLERLDLLQKSSGAAPDS